MNDLASGQVLLYQKDDGTPAIEVKLEKDTVWLSQQQIAELFGTTRENINAHLRNVFEEGELEEMATCKEFLQVRIEGTRTVRRKLLTYNLDAILSVGYRVKSAAATQFRIWATERLRDYLLKGYALNDQRLAQLGQIVEILGRSDDEILAGTAEIIADYLPGLTLLRDFDEGRIVNEPNIEPRWQLTIQQAREIIQDVAQKFPEDSLLGQERGDSLSGIIGAIYQSFAGSDLYPTAEEKAANLLYFVVKDHPLSDGNKRSAAALFITFLANNGLLLNKSGQRRISSNALATITLMVAMSDPQEKDLMVSLLIRIISGKTQ